MADLQRTGVCPLFRDAVCMLHSAQTLVQYCMCLPLSKCTTPVGSAAALQRHHNPQLHKCMQQIYSLTASIGTITAMYNSKLYYMYQLPALNPHAVQLLRDQCKMLFENMHVKSKQYET